LAALLDDARLRDCDETARVRDAMALLASEQPSRGTIALRKLSSAYTRLLDGSDRAAEALLCPVIGELISLARAVQHCEDAETRVERVLALYEAALRPEGGAR
jgi:hypothetical protein